MIDWFAEKSDLILLLFDAHKLDISDEFKEVITQLKRHDEKIRVVLNKADSIDTQSLMRVYGAMMWSLGKVKQTPEVTRVFIRCAIVSIDAYFWMLWENLHLQYVVCAISLYVAYVPPSCDKQLAVDNPNPSTYTSPPSCISIRGLPPISQLVLGPAV